MKTILFPTDFSEAAETAQNVAINFCKKNNAELFFLNIYQMPHVRSGSFSSSLIEIIRKDSHSKMEMLEKEIKTKHPELSATYKCILGDPIQMIDEIAEGITADLIVMGTHGASGIEEVLMGSNTQAVIKHSNTPVLAIPKNTDLDGIKNLAFASDLNFENSNKAIETIKSLCNTYNQELKVIHFAEFLDDTEEGEETLHHVLKDVKHSFMEQMTTSIEKGLEEYIKYEDIHLMMMIHRKHSFWERLFTSSNSEKRAMHTKIPLLILKEDK
ncbi:MAG: universal stress protein [Flavobacteriales bacterium]